MIQEKCKKMQNYLCDFCDIITNNRNDFNNHNCTASYKNSKYSCESCNFTTNNKYNFNKHNITIKHKKNILDTSKTINKSFYCPCGKTYKYHSGLSIHKKSCEFINKLDENIILCKSKLNGVYSPELYEKLIEEYNENINNKVYYECKPNDTEKEMINEILKSNQELITQLMHDNKEFKSMLIEALHKPNSVMNNCNNNNKTQFNLQLFLNETCKDAMNMQDFIESIKINYDEWENMGKLGYVQGVTNIFVKALGDLDETERPVHCTDKKREIFYIKDNNVWEKEDITKKRIRLIIKMILHRCIQFIIKWKEENPTWTDIDSKKHGLYMKSLNQITTGITPDDDLGISKVIRTIAGRVWVNK